MLGRFADAGSAAPAASATVLRMARAGSAWCMDIVLFTLWSAVLETGPRGGIGREAGVPHDVILPFHADVRACRPQPPPPCRANAVGNAPGSPPRMDEMDIR
jgi:hypothetical protein